MNLKQIDKLEESLKLELQANLEAIRLVRRLLKERSGKPSQRAKRNDPLLSELLADNPSTNARKVNGESSDAWDSGKSIEALVVNAISKIEGHFGLSEIKQKLSELYPKVEFNRNTLSGIIFRQKGKAFRVISQGQGRRAAVYERM